MNLQNIVRGSVDFPEGKWWREAFKAPEGRTLVVADYSQQEIRCAAERSGDPTLLAMLKEGKDIHRLTASALFDIPESLVSGEQRSEAKTSFFAGLYGAGVDKLMKQFKVSKMAAKRMQAAIFSNYPEIIVMQEASFNRSMQNGYITIDDITGRRCYIPEYETIKALDILRKWHPKYEKDYKKLISKVFRNSSNFILQGLAASITKYASVLIRERLKNTSGQLVLTVHDEIIVECNDTDSSFIKEIVETAMLEASRYFCKLIDIPAEAKVSQTWSK